MPSDSLRHPWEMLLVGACLLGPAAPTRAESPLHERIDRLIAAKKPGFDVQAAPLSSDAEFLRRIYLDLTGTVPPVTEARAFLQDRSPAKRQALIDKLLASPEHAYHLQNVFDAVFMERRRGKNVPAAQWREYLRASFAANKPWDRLVSEILSADGADPKTRSAARFYLDREGEPHVVARDVGRLFLGKNYRCAQCHDHPIVEEYKQAHYYGLFAFYNRSVLFTDKNKQVVWAEKADGEVSFQSVFDPAKVTKMTGPRLPGGSALKEPALEKGKEYTIAPANGVRPVPRFSRRAQVAALLTGPESAAFRRTSANRFWALMIGRGLVHPLDLDHGANPPSHPELLTLLGDEFAARKYDVRSFLREMALSKTYQRSSEAPASAKEAPPESFAVALLKPLSPEQFAWSLMQATGLIDSERKALGKNATAAALQSRLAGNVAALVNTFGSAPGQPEGAAFEATLDQALFLSNGALIRDWLAPRSGNLTERLVKLPTAEAVADELYLSILTRPPDPEERQEVAASLKDRTKDRTASLQEMAWALLTSAEFRFNH